MYHISAKKQKAATIPANVSIAKKASSKNKAKKKRLSTIMRKTISIDLGKSN